MTTRAGERPNYVCTDTTLFDALGVPVTEINIDEDRIAAARVMRLNDGMRSVPTILFPDGSVLVEPSNAALEAKLAAYADGSR